MNKILKALLIAGYIGFTLVVIFPIGAFIVEHTIQPALEALVSLAKVLLGWCVSLRASNQTILWLLVSGVTVLVIGIGGVLVLMILVIAIYVAKSLMGAIAEKTGFLEDFERLLHR